MADAFDFQQAPVDLSADLLQVRQVGQSLVHSEVVRVAESSFRPATAPFLEVLFQIEVLVVDVQAGMDPVLDRRGCGTRPGVFFVTTRSKINCTRSGRPRSRLSRMISSKNSRPRKGRSKICVRLTSICQIDKTPVVAGRAVFRRATAAEAASATSGTPGRCPPAPANRRSAAASPARRRTGSHCPRLRRRSAFFSNCRLAHSCPFRHRL